MFHPKNSIVLLVIAIYAGSVTCDYYSSVHGLEVLLEAEGFLLNSLRDFLTTPKAEEFSKALRRIEDEYKEASDDSAAYISNPISAFKLIKRFVVDWTVIEEYVHNDTSTKDLDNVLTGFMNGGFTPPTENDLRGAALGLVRLKETYALNVSDLAEGKLLGTKYSSAMSPSDCLEVGLSLYDAKEYRRALPWLFETMAKLMALSDPPKPLMSELLPYMSATCFYLDNPKMALLLTDEILQMDPANQVALENKKVYQQKVLEDRNSRKFVRKPLAEPKKPTLNDLHEMTCRGERHQTPSEQRPLRCIYSTNGVPYHLIAPFKVEQLNQDPPIVYYHDVLTETNIQNAIEAAKPTIVRSTVGDLSSVVSEIRTSKTGWLYYEKLDFLAEFSQLLTDITGLSLSTAEALQIINYGIGGHYGPHFDFSLDPTEAYGDWRGNRIATALFYLNDVELGGATAFPFLKLAVPPVKGSMVLWYNLHESLEPDFRTKHSGCPVLKGSKWVVNEWFHERDQEFRRPCSLEQQGAISKPFELIF